MKSNGKKHLATFKPTCILLQGGVRGRDFRRPWWGRDKLPTLAGSG